MESLGKLFIELRDLLIVHIGTPVSRIRAPRKHLGRLCQEKLTKKKSKKKVAFQVDSYIFPNFKQD